MAIERKYTSTLLVEGNDDQHVVWGICGKFNVTESFDVIDNVGLLNLLAQLPIRIKLRDPKLGILIDADTDLVARWQQLKNILSPLGYKLPDLPEKSGSIIRSEKADTVIGIWIMPDNQVPGMLEDFAEVLVPTGDATLPYAIRIIVGLSLVIRNTIKFTGCYRKKTT
jgi:muconolactone delta-isomerase